MGLNCIDLITKKRQGEITREQFYAALIELHNKYPMSGHNPPLTTFQITNYRSLKMKIEDPNYDVIYEDHLQPLNFLEAAEMYKQSLDKRDKEAIPDKAWKKRVWPVKEAMVEIKPERKERLPYADDVEEAPF